jgi:predicted nuclease of predicted toxin-antitoxin system
MRFKVDENLPAEAAELLRYHAHDVLTVTEQSLNGQPDPEVAKVCRAEQRALVTLDLGFGDLRCYPPGDYAGIIVLRPDVQSIQSVLRLLHRLLPIMEEEPLTGSLWIVDEHRVRIRGEKAD